MEREGPMLEALLRRIAETPEDFLREPLISGKGEVHVAAVAGDLCRAHGTAPDQDALARLSAQARNAQAAALIGCWLLADDWFFAAKVDGARVLALLGADLVELAQQTASRKLMSDPDRREELARLALARLGYRPQGESREQAEDRLTSLSAVERKRVMQAAKKAEQRAREIREQLARQAAQEAADKWTRE